MRLVRFAALLFGMLVGTVPVHASLIEADWVNPGDRLITVDTQTQLTWLDVTVTSGKSAGDVLALLQSDSRYSGFRYATPLEFLQLAQNAGIPRLDGFVVPENLAPTLALLDLVGATIDFEPLTTLGMVEDSSFGPDLWPIAVLYANSNPSFDTLGAAVLYPSGGLATTASNPRVGSWLVAQVPTPGTLQLLALASFLLVCHRRRARA